MELKNWILSGVVVLLLGILGWLTQNIAVRILNRLDAMLSELQKLTSMMVKHEEELKSIHETQKDHAMRIRELENKIKYN